MVSVGLPMTGAIVERSWLRKTWTGQFPMLVSIMSIYRPSSMFLLSSGGLSCAGVSSEPKPSVVWVNQ